MTESPFRRGLLFSCCAQPQGPALTLYLGTFWLTPYVVNIGFTKNWRRAPQWAVLVLAAIALVIDLAVFGTWWAPPLGFLVWAWLVYFSAHLGISFVLSALVATPGCEMRAIPHLWTLTTGRSTKEHYCPGPLDRIDRWEAHRGH